MIWFKPRLWRGFCAVLCALAGLAVPHANAADETLRKLMNTGRITLGSREVAVPTAYVDASGAHVGYHMDICQRIVQAIRQRFDMPALKVVTLTVTAATRIAMLNNGTTDIDCGHNPVTPSALQQSLLAHATLVADVRIMTTTDKQAMGLAGLDGRTVATTVGVTVLPMLRSYARQSKIKINEAYGRNVAEIFNQLEAGRADAVAAYLPYLMAQRDKVATPDRFVLMEGVLRSEPAALALRVNDEELLAVTNEVIDAMMRTGEMERLYNKWFVEPVPGLKHALRIPMPDKLRGYFAKPGSEMLDF